MILFRKYMLTTSHRCLFLQVFENSFYDYLLPGIEVRLAGL